MEGAAASEAEHVVEPTPEPPRAAPDAGATRPSTRIVRFESTPPAAAVRVGDRVLCETPSSLVVSLTRRLPGRPGPRVPSMSDDPVEPAPPPSRER